MVATSQFTAIGQMVATCGWQQPDKQAADAFLFDWIARAEASGLAIGNSLGTAVELRVPGTFPGVIGHRGGCHTG